MRRRQGLPNTTTSPALYAAKYTHIQAQTTEDDDNNGDEIAYLVCAENQKTDLNGTHTVRDAARLELSWIKAERCVCFPLYSASCRAASVRETTSANIQQC